MATTNKVCAKCGAEIASHHSECPFDGGYLKPAVPETACEKLLADKFDVISLVGRGATSAVYKARQKPINRIVAIKVLSAHLVDNPVASGRFEREARAIAMLKHPNIVTVFDFGTSADHEPYLMMDWVDGTPLDQVIFSEGHLLPTRALPIFRQIASALAHAHERNVVHRDLKPQNICISKQADGTETVTIIDFGLAKFLNPEPETERNLTRPGLTCGSPLYMSPEQVHGRNLDGRSDIYSLGCLMHEALSGNPPFKGDTTFETMSKHVEQPTPPFASILGIPPSIEAVVKRAMEKKPQDRYQTTEQLLSELN